MYFNNRFIVKNFLLAFDVEASLHLVSCEIFQVDASKGKKNLTWSKNIDHIYGIQF